MKIYQQFNTAKILIVLIFCLFASAANISAQDAKTDNPISRKTKSQYEGVKIIIARSAEKVPEKYYSFKPTKDIRSFGQIVGHLADSQYEMCSIAAGEKRPVENIEKTKTSKADLLAALNEAFAYCDKTYDKMQDSSSAIETVKFMGNDTPRIGVLTTNLMHSLLHYGNLITYMRLKNIVPPTSEANFFESLKK